MELKQYADSLIYRRRSIRKFTDEPVREEQLAHVLHAGMAGPSAHNMQPWSFAVIDERALLDAIADFHPYAKMMRQATMAVLVCIKKAVAAEDPFYQQDLGAAVQNMLLAATEAGLGSCWCGIHPNEELEGAFVRLLNVPGDLRPFAVVALGHPASETRSSDRFEASRVHRNAW